MGKFHRGDHIKFEIKATQTTDSEWLWLLVDHSDDEQRIVFGSLDSEPVAATDIRRGQELAVSYEHVREHRRFD